MQMKFLSRAYSGVVCLGGTAVVVSQILHWSSHDPLRLSCYLFLSMICSVLKIKLPGVMGTMSVNFLFILMGVVDMSLGETLLIGCVGTLVQCLWRPKVPSKPIQTCFSLANTSISIGLCYSLFHWPVLQRLNSG